jgi:FkbM family methyltransferase
MRVIDGDKWVSRALSELGEYSEQEFGTLRVLLSIIRRCKGTVNVIDAGAYIGDLTVPLSRVADKVIAFEPQVEVREILLHNLKENGCYNVTVLPYALGSTDCSVEYTTVADSPGSTMMSGDGSSIAEARRLDSLIMPTIDLLKADVEGMEVLLLAGAQELIQRDRPVLFLERDTVQPPEGMPTLKEALTILQYDQYDMNFPIWQSDNFNHAPNTFGNTYSFMTLAIPRPL